MSTMPQHGKEQPGNHQPGEQEQQADGFGHQLSAAAANRLHARDDGTLDVTASIGGWRGLAEAALPATAFLTAYLLTEQLGLAVILALSMGAVFTVLRLIQRGSLIQSFSGLVGIGICAIFATVSGEARDYFMPGFFINAGYLALFVGSIAVRWPLMGLIFGFFRTEGLHWRHDTIRRRRYALATWIVSAVLVTRLMVQVPLYLAENDAALGATRIVMGVPLYALALWLGWMITRPKAQQENTLGAAQDAGGPRDADQGRETAGQTPPGTP